MDLTNCLKSAGLWSILLSILPHTWPEDFTQHLFRKTHTYQTQKTQTAYALFLSNGQNVLDVSGKGNTKQKINKIVFPKIIHAEQKRKKKREIEVRNINPQLVTPFPAEEGSAMKNIP